MLSESERRIKILEYVREHSIGVNQKQIKKITKSDVMRHLKEVRPMTTHKTIVELIKEGKINMVKDKPYSQTDYLVLNENNDFNILFWEFYEIELIILRMFDNYMTIHDKKVEKEIDRKGPFKDLNSVIDFYFPLIIDIMLHNLLVQINKKITYSIDKEILYPRVITLIDKMNSLPLSIRSTTVLDSYTEAIRKLMVKKSVRDCAGDIGIKLIAIDDLLTRADKFKKNFMSQSG